MDIISFWSKAKHEQFFFIREKVQILELVLNNSDIIKNKLYYFPAEYF